MKCQNCQFDIQENAKSCPFCNFTVGDPAPESPQDSPPAPEPSGPVHDAPDEGGPPVPQQGEEAPSGPAEIQDLSDETSIPDVMPVGPPPSVPEPQPVPPSGPGGPDDGFEPPPIPKQRNLLKIIGPLAAACVMGYVGYVLYVPKKSTPQYHKGEQPSAADLPPPAAPAVAASTASAAATPGAAQPAPQPALPGGRSSDPLAVDPRMAAMLESQKPPPEAADPGDAPEGEAGRKPATPAVKQGDVWVFEGTVRDIISFKPVRGAQMLFVSIRNENDFTTTSNSRGLYRISLPGDAQGYRLMVDHPEYLADYFLDAAGKPFKSMPKGSRLQLRSAKPSHPAWIGTTAQPSERDVFLFPDITD